MAFIKTCVGTVLRCARCGNPGILKIAGKNFCQTCAESEKKTKTSKK